jgi:hypothetical protein
MIRQPRVPRSRRGDHAGRRPSGRPAEIRSVRWRRVRPELRTMVSPSASDRPAGRHEDDRAHRISVFAPRSHRGIWAGLPASGRPGPSGSADADHVFKGAGEPQPSCERVDSLTVQQPPAWRIGALLELERDTHHVRLVHTRQHRRRGGGPRHGATVVFGLAAGRCFIQARRSATRSAAGRGS